MPSKLIETTVEPPAGGKLVTVTNLDLVKVEQVSSLSSLIAAVKADHALFERHSNIAAFIALRIGLRLVWVKYNSGHGSLEPFIAEHFAEISRSSLTRYIRIADAFASDSDMRDKKQKLTDATKIKPILEQQLELFTDPAAKLDIHCKQLVDWVKGRGLTQIYRDLSEEDDAPLPPVPVKGAKKPKKTPEQAAREAFEEALTAFKASFSEGDWKHLYTRDRDALEAWLGKAARSVKEHSMQAAQETRRAVKGGKK